MSTAVISLKSQPRANRHPRSTVAGDTSNIAATSAIENPPSNDTDNLGFAFVELR
jgi:hypothetical protein